MEKFVACENVISGFETKNLSKRIMPKNQLSGHSFSLVSTRI